MSSRARGEQHEIMGEGYLRIIRTGVGVAFNSCLGCVRESCRHDVELVGPAVVVPDKDRCSVCVYVVTGTWGGGCGRGGGGGGGGGWGVS